MIYLRLEEIKRAPMLPNTWVHGVNQKWGSSFKRVKAVKAFKYDFLCFMFLYSNFKDNFIIENAF